MTKDPKEPRAPFIARMPVRLKMVAVGLAATMATAMLGLISYVTDRETARQGAYLYYGVHQPAIYARAAQNDFGRLDLLVQAAVAADDLMRSGSRERDAIVTRMATRLGEKDPASAAAFLIDEIVGNLRVAAETEQPLPETIAARPNALIADVEGLRAGIVTMLGDDPISAEQVAIWVAGWERLGEDIEYFIQDLAAEGFLAAEAFDAQTARAGWIIIAALFGAIVIAVVASAVLGEMVVRKVRAAVAFSDSVAAGDLDRPAQVVGNAELAVLMRGLDSMRDAIRGKIQELDELLNNILPRPIADRLRAGERRIADGRAEAVVVFLDIVGFTQLTRRLGASHLIETLDRVFSDLDEAAEACRIEKIKTIGDAYMAAAGVVAEPQSDDAKCCAEFALRAQDIIAKAGERLGYPLQSRIGLHNGPLVAGVLGKSKMVFDIWGDAVNLASRLESSAPAGEIRVSEAAYWRLRPDFDLEPAGEVELKGVGATPVYRLIGPKADAAPSAQGDEKVAPFPRAAT